MQESFYTLLKKEMYDMQQIRNVKNSNVSIFEPPTTGHSFYLYTRIIYAGQMSYEFTSFYPAILDDGWIWTKVDSFGGQTSGGNCHSKGFSLY
jgi:O-antigen ligase